MPYRTTLPTSCRSIGERAFPNRSAGSRQGRPVRHRDRKSTRLNSSHSQISYAVFCLKKKNTTFIDHHWNVGHEYLAGADSSALDAAADVYRASNPVVESRIQLIASHRVHAQHYH